MIKTKGGLRRLMLLAATAAAILASVALVGCSAESPNAVGVNAVMTDPAAYSGTIAIKGVVQKVDAATSSITMIDEGEYATCGLTPCNSAGLLPLSMPAAQYDGELPALEDVVIAVGEIKSTPQGSYFDVERVERNGSVLVSKK